MAVKLRERRSEQGLAYLRDKRLEGCHQRVWSPFMSFAGPKAACCGPKRAVQDEDRPGSGLGRCLAAAAALEVRVWKITAAAKKQICRKLPDRSCEETRVKKRDGRDRLVSE